MIMAYFSMQSGNFEVLSARGVVLNCVRKSRIAKFLQEFGVDKRVFRVQTPSLSSCAEQSGIGMCCHCAIESYDDSRLMVSLPKVHEKQSCTFSGFQYLLLKANTYLLVLLLAATCNSVAVRGETRSSLNNGGEKAIKQFNQRLSGGLLVTVSESPAVFQRAGQTIKLVYLIKNMSSSSIFDEVKIVDSDAQVVCMQMKRQALPPGGTILCRASVKIDQQHFMDGELRHNFLAVSGGNISNIQESVVCRQGWESECNTNTRTICDMHQKMNSSIIRPDICDAMSSNTAEPNATASPDKFASGAAFIDSISDHRVSANEARPPGVKIGSSDGGVAVIDTVGKYSYSGINIVGWGVEPRMSFHIDKSALPTGSEIDDNKSQMIACNFLERQKINFAARRKQMVRVDLLPTAFAPNQTILLPVWKKRLTTVAEIVSKKESLLKIILHSESDPHSLSKARVSKVRSELLSDLIARGNIKLPDIELHVIGRLTD
jgi:hypothetical protein